MSCSASATQDKYFIYTSSISPRHPSIRPDTYTHSNKPLPPTQKHPPTTRLGFPKRCCAINSTSFMFCNFVPLLLPNRAYINAIHYSPVLGLNVKCFGHGVHIRRCWCASHPCPSVNNPAILCRWSFRGRSSFSYSLQIQLIWRPAALLPCRG